MENNQLYDIYTYEFVPFWQTTLFYLLMGALFLTLIMSISVSYYRWRLKHKPLEPAWQKAIRSLASMAEQKFTNKHGYKAAYFALTMLIKVYLYEEHGWPVIHKTDDELVAFLRSKKVDKEIVLLLEQIVQGILEIKFADAQALQENYLRHIQCAQEFIEKTKKQPYGNRS